MHVTLCNNILSQGWEQKKKEEQKELKCEISYLSADLLPTQGTKLQK